MSHKEYLNDSNQPGHTNSVSSTVESTPLQVPKERAEGRIVSKIIEPSFFDKSSERAVGTDLKPSVVQHQSGCVLPHIQQESPDKKPSFFCEVAKVNPAVLNQKGSNKNKRPRDSMNNAELNNNKSKRKKICKISDEQVYYDRYMRWLLGVIEISEKFIPMVKQKNTDAMQIENYNRDNPKHTSEDVEIYWVSEKILTASSPIYMIKLNKMIMCYDPTHPDHQHRKPSLLECSYHEHPMQAVAETEAPANGCR
jgi:hypothetical protein